MGNRFGSRRDNNRNCKVNATTGILYSRENRLYPEGIEKTHRNYDWHHINIHRTKDHVSVYFMRLDYLSYNKQLQVKKKDHHRSIRGDKGVVILVDTV